MEDERRLERRRETLCEGARAHDVKLGGSTGVRYWEVHCGVQGLGRANVWIEPGGCDGRPEAARCWWHGRGRPSTTGRPRFDGLGEALTPSSRWHQGSAILGTWRPAGCALSGDRRRSAGRTGRPCESSALGGVLRDGWPRYPREDEGVARRTSGAKRRAIGGCSARAFRARDGHRYLRPRTSYTEASPHALGGSLVSNASHLESYVIASARLGELCGMTKALANLDAESAVAPFGKLPIYNTHPRHDTALPAQPKARDQTYPCNLTLRSPRPQLNSARWRGSSGLALSRLPPRTPHPARLSPPPWHPTSWLASPRGRS